MSKPERIESEDHEVAVGSALQRHQLRQYLLAAHKQFALIEWREQPFDDLSIFTITASPAQWTAINQWLEKTKVGP